jgi:hypothetical protein
VLAIVGFALQMTVPSPLTKRREYEAYLRAPGGGITLRRYGTRDAYRLGGDHVGRMSVFPEPADAFAGDFGIQESGQVTVQLVDPDAPVT